MEDVNSVGDFDACSEVRLTVTAQSVRQHKRENRVPGRSLSYDIPARTRLVK